MAKQDRGTANLSDRALEMIMRDVLDGLQEWSLESAFSDSETGFEIIDIRPAREKRQAVENGRPAELGGNGEIIPFPRKHRAWG
jgi:hypothetical protein